MKDKKKRERNVISTTFFTTFLQKILSSKLLQAIINGKQIILVVDSNYNQ